MRSRFRVFLKNFERMGTKKPQRFLHVVRGFCNAHMRKIFPFFRVEAGGAGGRRPCRQARSASAPPYSTYITYSTYSILEKGDFSRPDAI